MNQMQHKMPHSIKKVQQEILQHPEYKTKLDSIARFCFESMLSEAEPTRAREDNKWYREIWKYLYLDEDVNGEFRQEPETVATQQINSERAPR